MKACTNFHIELETIDPTTNWFVIGRSKLDSPKVLAPPLYDQIVDGTFILDKSALDSTKDLLEGYGATSPGYVWQEVTTTSTYVDIRRGVDVSNSISARPFAGVMEVRIIDPYLDALANEYVGLGVRARLRVGTDIVFLGKTTRLKTEYDAIGIPTLYLTATDAISRLNSMYMAARPAENYASRISAICTAAEVFSDISGVGQTLTPTDGEKTALDTLYAAQDSEGSLVWVDRWNEVYALTRGQEAAGTTYKYHFSNDHTTLNHICMSAFLNSLDTDEVINQIDFNNQTYDETDPLNPKFINTTHTFVDTSSAKYYGVKKLSVSTNLDASTLDDYSHHIFDNYSEAHSQVKSIAFPMDHFKDLSIPEAVFIDVADPIKITLNDPVHTGLDNIETIQRVATISHRITPTYWDCQISLI